MRKLRVEIETRLIEDLLRTGNRQHATCIVKGLPVDAKLKVVNGGVAQDSIPLTFETESEGPDEEIVTPEVHTLRSF